MGESQMAQKDAGTMIMDLIAMLMEDQTGEPQEYRRIDVHNEETA